jgi:hypothetical protein
MLRLIGQLRPTTGAAMTRSAGRSIHPTPVCFVLFHVVPAGPDNLHGQRPGQQRTSLR